ncbi:hypothetical protein LVD15_13030 [Fulvivirga maritima]|uniref:hypothetical protein n=1 Tax=Fulvivirga maritima TaxID=2904247 RepID=UPI001F3CEF57|nr:hypothetical protein [Fulvivirga maritima]UII29309.1 hypothetical protein LVD15_13030 [Fulvivirga maritima]
MLKHLKHTQIDQKKWDECLMQSPDGMVYCQYWFLSIIHPDWEAWVIEKNDAYSFIMPLLSHKNYGFSLHPKPVLAQRLGMFGFISDEIIKEVKSEIIKKFSSFIYPLNYNYAETFTGETQTNHILPLSEKYEELAAKYRRDRKSRLKQARKTDIEIINGSEADDLINLFKKEVSPKITDGVSDTAYLKIHELISESLKNDTGLLIKAIKDKQLISIAFFIKYKSRITYLFSANTDLGRSLNANSLILDEVIKKQSDSNCTLDFEGSHIPGIAYFFKSFGAIEEKYFLIKYESTVLKTLKKLKSITKK